MRNLINFFFRYNSWLLFVLLVGVSLALLFNFNDFHQSVYLSSANSVSASIHGMRTEFTGYIGLREENRKLEATNARLQAKVMELERTLQVTRELVPDTSSFIPQPERFSFIVGSVLNSGTARASNYITINKGTDQGVSPGMGVINSSGMVGIINVCGRNTSRAISVLNTGQHFSVKVEGTNYVGTLSWFQGDPSVAYVEDIPRHARVSKGAMVVTSGYSTTFPEGIPVGRIVSRVKGRSSNYFTLKIKLIPDFKHIQTVWIINDVYKAELDTLQKYDR